MSPAAAALLHSSSASVQILDISCVKPFHATKRFNLFLPFADSCLNEAEYTRTVFFYSLDTHNANALNLEALKHGLSLALVPFYPVAGRLRNDETGQLTIDCNDSGVEFVEAVIDCALADLEGQSFPIHDFYDDLARFSPTTEPPHDPALLSIQVTRFQGGHGVAIGVAASHVACDGHSLFYFLKSWGQCCRGHGVSLPPLHVRTLMSSEFWGGEKSSKKSVQASDIWHSLPPPSSKAYQKIMHFDSTSAQQLKRTAIEESGNVRISTFQAVIACVWKRITAAEDMPPHQKVRFLIAANVRNRIMPSLTDAYFGNAVLYPDIRTTAGELQRESAAAIAAKINESLKVIEDQEYLREKFAAREEDFFGFFDEILREGNSEKIVMVSLGSRLPVFEVDVGMGKPVAVRPAYLSTEGTLLCVYAGREAGSISVSLRFSTLKTLQAFLSIPSPCIDI